MLKYMYGRISFEEKKMFINRILNVIVLVFLFLFILLCHVSC